MFSKREGLPFRCPIVPPSYLSDKYVPPKREVLRYDADSKCVCFVLISENNRAIRKSTALNPKATLWRFSPSSFRPVFRLATRR